MKNAFHIPEAAMASPLILAARASSPGVQQARDAMVSGMMTIFVVTMLLGCLSAGLGFLLGRISG